MKKNTNWDNLLKLIKRKNEIVFCVLFVEIGFYVLSEEMLGFESLGVNILFRNELTEQINQKTFSHHSQLYFIYNSWWSGKGTETVLLKLKKTSEKDLVNILKARK